MTWIEATATSPLGIGRLNIDDLNYIVYRDGFMRGMFINSQGEKVNYVLNSLEVNAFAKSSDWQPLLKDDKV